MAVSSALRQDQSANCVEDDAEDESEISTDDV